MSHDEERPVTHSRMSVAQMMELQEAYWGALDGSRRRIEDARALVRGDVPTPLPEAVRAQGFQKASFDGPESSTVPLHLLNKLASKRPELKRHPIGQGIAAESTATRLEQWGNAAMDRLFSWDDAADLCLIEGEAAAIVQLAGSQFGRLPDLYADDGSEEYNPSYARDASGRGPADDGYTRPDHARTARAYTAARLDWMGRHFPLEVRVLSRLQQVPINPRLVGQRVEIDGLLVRSRYSRTGLIKRGWRWEGMQDGYQSQATGVAGNGTTWGGLDEVTLYEAWLEDEDGPFAAFSVDGKPTRKESDGDEELVDGVLDLKEAWGVTTLPIAYTYGLRWADPDPDRRSIQFPLLLKGMWEAQNVIRSAMTYHTFATAFLGFAYRPDPAVVKAMADAGLPLTVDVKPMSVIPIAGDLSPLVHPGSGRDALALYASYARSADEQGPAAAALGGGTADSAIGQTVQGRDAMVAVHHAGEGARLLYERVGGLLLEVGCAVSEKFDSPLPIARNLDTPIAQPGPESSPSRAPIMLRHRDAGGVYEYTATFVKQRGEDLAKRQQNVELVNRRLMTVRQFLDEDGDPAPEITEAAIAAEDLAKTPVVQARRLRLAAQYAGDQEQATLLRAMAEQQAAPNSTVEQPVPMGLLEGVAGPPGMGGPQPGAPGPGASVPGVSMGSMAGSQLGGIVGAGMQAGPVQAIAAAGGDTSGLTPPPVGG